MARKRTTRPERRLRHRFSWACGRAAIKGRSRGIINAQPLAPASYLPEYHLITVNTSGSEDGARCSTPQITKVSARLLLSEGETSQVSRIPDRNMLED